MYLKTHSYGEFVFDWAWANAYEQHGVAYYPKALIAVPFTPVPGTRLMAKDTECAALLSHIIKTYVKQHNYSSAHLLFGASQDLEASHSSDYMLRHTVQFHWQNANYENFDHFLSALNQDKRKKIKQERAKVSKAGVSLVAKEGEQITQEDWDFFYKCYAQTYFEHGNAPYLSRAFFEAMQHTMANNWLLFIAHDSQHNPIASSLIGLSDPLAGQPRVAFGRYWGALNRVDCLHFEACYYAPIEWCIQNGFDRFEGGAQGEHKMARALMPVRTSSAHYLTHPEFARAVKNFLSREEKGIDNYMEDLQTRTPLKRGAG
jgi:predicted N-acyltransferase